MAAERGSRPGGGGERTDRDGRGVELPDSWDGARPAARRAATAAPAPAPRRQPRRPPYLVLAVGSAVVALVTIAAAAIAWQLTDAEESVEPRAEVVPAPAPSSAPPAVTEAPPAAPSPTSLAGGSAVPAAASAAPPASASAAPPASVSASAAPAAPPPPASAAACFATLLPEGALGDPLPDLSSCCSGDDGYATMLKLKAALVRVGGGGITPAMNEWSILGWHETAAFAVMRAHCCPDAPVLTVSERYAKCRMDESLAYLANALDDDGKMREAREHYYSAAQCLAGSGWGGSFNQYGYPHKGELASLDRILARLQAARRR